MNKFRCVLVFICILGSITSTLHANHKERDNKAFRNFWHPTFHGERLNYCTFDESQCGQTVANRYCRMLGYDYSHQNKIAYNIGLTHFLDKRFRCIGWKCAGFMNIGCATTVSHAPPKPWHYREKRFLNPRFNDYRVDWCYAHQKGCGLKAANSFCARIGYMKAKYFIKQGMVGATQSIGNQQLCFGQQCNAFKMIVCFR